MIRNQCCLNARIASLAIFFLIAALATLPAQAQTYTVVHAFAAGTDGAVPGPLIGDAQGNFYGTTRFGGSVDCGEDTCGTIYKIDSSGNETVLYRFQGSDGSNPLSALFRDAAGNLYGTTQGNGFDGGQSVVFKLAPNGSETTLFVGGNVNQGCCLDSPVAVDAQGNVYGMSPYGGEPNCNLNNDGLGCGTLFRISPSGKFTLLHVFNGNDGMQPEGGVVLDGKGNLYGTANFGGELSCESLGYGYAEPGCGTIYKLDSKGEFTVLHKFGGKGDGSFPLGLIIDSAGNLYGIAQNGGDEIPKTNYEYGVGTIFKVDPTGNFSVLYTFTPCTQPPCHNGDPRNPVFASHLVKDSQGNLYGLEQENDCGKSGGCLFKLDPQGNLTDLYDFEYENEGPDGFTPMGVVLGSHHDLYGTMETGGPPINTCAEITQNGCGTVFHLTAH